MKYQILKYQFITDNLIFDNIKISILFLIHLLNY